MVLFHSYVSLPEGMIWLLTRNLLAVMLRNWGVFLSKWSQATSCFNGPSWVSRNWMFYYLWTSTTIQWPKIYEDEDDDDDAAAAVVFLISVDPSQAVKLCRSWNFETFALPIAAAWLSLSCAMAQQVLELLARVPERAVELWNGSSGLWVPWSMERVCWPQEIPNKALLLRKWHNMTNTSKNTSQSHHNHMDLLKVKLWTFSLLNPPVVDIPGKMLIAWASSLGSWSRDRQFKHIHHGFVDILRGWAPIWHPY